VFKKNVIRFFGRVIKSEIIFLFHYILLFAESAAFGVVFWRSNEEDCNGFY